MHTPPLLIPSQAVWIRRSVSPRIPARPAHHCVHVTTAALRSVYITHLISLHLDRSANLPEGLYILPSVVSFFFIIWAKLSLNLLEQFYDFCTKWKVLMWMLSNWSSFSDSSGNVAMATNFVSDRTCSLGAKVSQDPLDQFSQSLQHMVGRWSIRPSFSDILRDVAMATNLVAKMGQNYLPPALIALLFRNGIRYRYLNVCVNNANDTSKSC